MVMKSAGGRCIHEQAHRVWEFFPLHQHCHHIQYDITSFSFRYCLTTLLPLSWERQAELGHPALGSSHLAKGAACPCLLISKQGPCLASTSVTCHLWWHSSMRREERLLSQGEGLKDTSLQESWLMEPEVSLVVLLMGPFSYLFGSHAWKPLFCIRPQFISVPYNTVYKDNPFFLPKF